MTDGFWAKSRKEELPTPGLKFKFVERIVDVTDKVNNKVKTGEAKEEETFEYDFLKKLTPEVKRQKIIGNYIADFYCPQCKVVIELDGSQHFESDVAARDKERDNYFAERGIKVLRYANNEINNNFDGVCTDILINLGLL